MPSFGCEFEDLVSKHENDFKQAGVSYRYLLIDDAVAQLMKSEGGNVACIDELRW